MRFECPLELRGQIFRPTLLLFWLRGQCEGECVQGGLGGGRGGGEEEGVGEGLESKIHSNQWLLFLNSDIK